MRVLVIGSYFNPLQSLIEKKYTCITDPEKAVTQYLDNFYDIIVTSLHMNPIDGFDILKEIARKNLNVISIVTSGDKEPKSIMRCYELGASAFINEPFELEELEYTMTRLLEEKKRRSELELYRKKALPKEINDVLVGSSMILTRIKSAILQYADTRATVFIQGSSGTGKGVIAKLLHVNSGRKDKPFISINCGAIPENLIESELFGHEKGAFTGAHASKTGIIEQADGGTLFLDEVAELNPATQVALLKVLEDKVIRRVSGQRDIPVDVRFITATNKDLKEMIEQKEFREDLYYRLNVLNIFVPDLAERKEDIPDIAVHLLYKLNTEQNRHLKGFTKKALEKLMLYTWPGNIRELRNIIERAVIHTGGNIIDDFDIEIFTDYKQSRIIDPHLSVQGAGDAATDMSKENNCTVSDGSLNSAADIKSKVNELQTNYPIQDLSTGLKLTMENYEKELIINALKRNQGNQSKTAVF